MSQLRADAAKWFADSNGDVRIALVIAIKDSRVDIEKWQLAPEGASPLDLQVPDSQQPYCAQEITITPQGVTGTPLVLPFTALYDRVPGPGETDVLITTADCLKITTRMW